MKLKCILFEIIKNLTGSKFSVNKLPEQFTFLFWGTLRTFPVCTCSPAGGTSCVPHVSTPSTSCSPQPPPSSSMCRSPFQWSLGCIEGRSHWRRRGLEWWGGCCWTPRCLGRRSPLCRIWRPRSKAVLCFWWSSLDVALESYQGLKKNKKANCYNQIKQ